MTTVMVYECEVYIYNDDDEHEPYKEFCGRGIFETRDEAINAAREKIEEVKKRLIKDERNTLVESIYAYICQVPFGLIGPELPEILY